MSHEAYEWLWRILLVSGLFVSGGYVYVALTKQGTSEPFRWSQLVRGRLTLKASSRKKLLIEGVTLFVLTVVGFVWHTMRH